MRTDLALVDHAVEPCADYRWPLQYPVLIGGVRPNEMDWYVFDSPGWYLGEGWALTPETAGVAEEDHRGPGIAPIDGWIRRRAGSGDADDRRPQPRWSTARRPRVTVTIDGRAIDDSSSPPGSFLRFLRLPEGALDGAGRYARISVAADGPPRWRSSSSTRNRPGRSCSDSATAGTSRNTTRPPAGVAMDERARA